MPYLYETEGYAKTPTTEAGWESYAAPSGGSTPMRLFLPAATNLVTDPRLQGGLVAVANSMAGTPSYQYVDNGDGCRYFEVTYTVTATDVSNNSGWLAIYLNETYVFTSGDWCAAKYEYYISEDSSFYNNRGYTVETDWVTDLIWGSNSTTGAWADSGITPAQVANSVNRYFVLEVVDLLAGSIVEGHTYTFRFRHPQITKEPVVVPYFDGSSTGCAWSGTTDASTSTRTASSLVVPMSVGDTAFTVAARIVPLWDGDDGIYHKLIRVTNAGAGGNYIEYQKDEYDRVNFACWDGVADIYDIYVDSSAWSAGEEHLCAASGVWETSYDGNFDGTPATESGTAANVDCPNPLTRLQFNVDPASNPAYCYIGPVVVSRADKGTTWLDDICDGTYDMDDPDDVWTNAMAEGDWIIPLVEDGDAYQMPYTVALSTVAPAVGTIQKKTSKTLRPNRFPNRYLTTDSNSDGLADGLGIPVNNLNGTPTKTVTADGQRIQYSGDPADDGSNQLQLGIAMWEDYIVSIADLDVGDWVRVSYDYEIAACSGCAAYSLFQVWDAGWGNAYTFSYSKFAPESGSISHHFPIPADGAYMRILFFGPVNCTSSADYDVTITNVVTTVGKQSTLTRSTSKALPLVTAPSTATISKTVKLVRLAVAPATGTISKAISLTRSAVAPAVGSITRKTSKALTTTAPSTATISTTFQVMIRGAALGTARVVGTAGRAIYVGIKGRVWT